MKSLRKNSLAVLLVILFTFAITTCDGPMGMGDPVDVEAPTIVIKIPEQNSSLGTKVLGDSIDISGDTWDNIGVEKLVAYVTNVRTKEKTTIKEEDFKYTIDNEAQTFSGYMYLPEPPEGGEVEYLIRIEALDAFNNKGGDSVTVIIDLEAPWVDDARIIRDPQNNFTFQQWPLRSNDWYEGLPDYPPIRWTNIDDFQNEEFILKLQITANWSGVAASRLHIRDSEGNKVDLSKLSGIENVYADDWGIRPYKQESTRTPEWKITHEMMTAFKTAYNLGPSYISFEVWAWNGNEWYGDWDTGEPKDITLSNPSAYRRQQIPGTIWYPESDYPTINIKNAEEGLLVVEEGSNIELEIYDDDELKEIYAILMTRANYVSFLTGKGLTEIELHNRLRLPAETALREELAASTINRFDPTQSAGTGNRQNNIEIPATPVGDYNLIVFVKDKKKDALNEQWGVYPPLRVQILDANAPIIIVNRPVMENIFPQLNSDGRTFDITGYTIDKMGTRHVLMAWIPNGISDTALTQLRDIAGDPAKLNGTFPRNDASIRIWKVEVEDSIRMDLNGVPYERNNFSRTFDLVEDFKREPGHEFPENLNKNLVLFTNSKNLSETEGSRTFLLNGYTTAPILNVVYPSYAGQNHSIANDLKLEMSVTSGGSVALKQDRVRILDITGTNVGSPNETYPGGGSLFTTTAPVATGNVYSRTILNSGKPLYFANGAQKNFYFEAVDILGNSATLQRNMVISDMPSINSVSSSNANEIYGSGREIRFTVTFTMPVNVTGTPRLKIFSTDQADLTTGTPSYYANYISGDGGTNLQFSWTVPTGAPRVTQVYSSIQPIDLNGGTIRALPDPANPNGGPTNLSHPFSLGGRLNQNNSGLGYDGTRPTITGVAFTQNNLRATYPLIPEGESYFNIGKDIILELTTNKPVRISGSPTATIQLSSGVTRTAVFTSITHNGTTNSTIYFKYTVNSTNDANLATGALLWTGNLTFPGGPITDNLNNPMSEGVGTGLSEAVRRGGDGTTGKRAYIKTTLPAVPSYTITSSATGGTLLTDSQPASVTTVNRNAPAYLHITPIANTTRFWLYTGTDSADGQINNTGTNTAASSVALTDKGGNNLVSTYKTTTYNVTAWVEDFAGNRSAVNGVNQNAPTRTVNINSRAAELVGISCTTPDGSYPATTPLTFRLAFNKPVRNTGTGTVRMQIQGTTGSFIGGVQEIVQTFTAGSRSMLDLNWEVPSGIRMENIKAIQITFSGFTDDFGNNLKTYSLNTAETADRRPIVDQTYNLQRPKLILEAVPPVIDRYYPGASGTTNNLTVSTAYGGGTVTGYANARDTSEQYLNGGIMGTNRNIVLRYDKNVTVQAGKTVTIRPYGDYAVPSVMTVADFDKVKNAVSSASQLKLTNTDNNNLPIAGDYNYYINNTHGLTEISNNVRPDTTTKWVLAFTKDVFDSDVRDIFTEAKWNVQTIPSSMIRVSGGNTITIPLLQDLPKGMIWEVIIEEGLVRDAAGNESAEVAAGAYRFWTQGTADPVIRVERYSYNGNTATTTVAAPIPKIDTRVRIDCATPGAAINFNVIRTSYRPAIVTGTTNTIWSSTSGTTATFFGTHTNASGGFNNNNIGNSATTAEGGYFSTLLHPVTIDSNGGVTTLTATTATGAITWAQLEQINANVAYRTINANTGAASYSTTHVFNNAYFFAGDAFRTSGTASATADTVTSNLNENLYSGRRDYIKATATKAAVSGGGDAQGPALTASNPGYEGVFKTTVLYREPRGNNSAGSARILVQGFDKPVIPVVTGFPLRDASYDPGTAQSLNDPFSKHMYRMSGTLGAGSDSQTDNNYIWVTWEIITDWYQKGKGYSSATSKGNYLNRDNNNNNAVTATYGAVLYRYQQAFYGE